MTPSVHARLRSLHRRLPALQAASPVAARERAAALEWLEAHAWVGAEATMLGEQLLAAEAESHRALQAAVRRGDGPAALPPWWPRRIGAGEDYDYLDNLLAGLLALPEPAPPQRPDAAELVRYQPTPARHIVDLLRRTRPRAGDVLVDLGAGLGHVPLLAAACTSAHCVGIEREPAYVDSARAAAASLALPRVRFVAADVRAVELSAGTLFYLYTPFRGAVLRGVLDRLQALAARRPLRVCSFGPCTAELAAECWLQAEAPVVPGRVAVFTAAPGGAAGTARRLATGGSGRGRPRA